LAPAAIEGFVNRYWEAIRAGWRDQRVPCDSIGPGPAVRTIWPTAQASSTSADDQQRACRQVLPRLRSRPIRPPCSRLLESRMTLRVGVELTRTQPESTAVLHLWSNRSSCTWTTQCRLSGHTLTQWAGKLYVDN
jgi:hypothetical protein